MKKNSRILKAAGGLFFLKVFGYAASFFVFVFLARLVTVEEFGVFSYIFSWLSILSVVSTFGLDKYLLREVAKDSSSNNWPRLLSKIRQVIIVSTIISIIVALVSGFAIASFTQIESDSLWYITFLGMLSLPLMSLNLVRQESLLGLKKVLLGQLPNLLIYPIALFLFCCFIKFVLKIELNASTLIISHGLSTLTTFLIGIRFLWNSTPRNVRGSDLPIAMSQYFNLGLFFFLIALSGIVFSRASVLLLGFMGDEKGTAIFNVSLRCTATITFILAAVNSASAPSMATLFRDRAITELQKLVTKTTIVIFIYSSIISLVLFFFGSQVLSLFGTEYIEGFPALRILCIGQFVNGATGSVGYLLQMTHHEKIAASTTTLGSILIVLGGILLIPSMGIIGAALVTTVARILTNIVNVVIAYRLIGVNTSIIPFHYLLES